MLVIAQYTDPICVLEEQLDHIITNTTVVLMRSQCKAAQAVRGLHLTELAANIDAWVTWPAVHHTQLFQAVVAQVTPLTQFPPAGAALVLAALLK
jgi:hypothetical protein